PGQRLRAVGGHPQLVENPLDERTGVPLRSAIQGHAPVAARGRHAGSRGNAEPQRRLVGETEFGLNLLRAAGFGLVLPEAKVDANRLQRAGVELERRPVDEPQITVAIETDPQRATWIMTVHDPEERAEVSEVPLRHETRLREQLLGAFVAN